MANVQANQSPDPLATRLACYGCTELIPLDEKLTSPAQLDYLDLLPSRTNQVPALTAVAEHQGTALLYLVDACGRPNTDVDSLVRVRRQLANRSDPAWLGVVKAGSLEIFPIGFHEAADTQPVDVIQRDSDSSPLFFQSLVHGTFKETNRPNGTDYVYRKIFNLLTQTTNEFVPREGKGQIDALEVLSMAGRALFFRFLIDRQIVLESELSGPDGICPDAKELKDAFSTARKAAQTSAWLDMTFNGDFLPLIDESIPLDSRADREAAYLNFYNRTEKSVGKRIFTHLHAILRGWRAVGDAFQTEIDWGDLDFAHIPVGVLSQVYESFSHRADPRTSRDTSVHYTPRMIARLMVNESFAALKDPAHAKVLDGSCGAGIFLVLAFRRLVREHWQKDSRPKTADIQRILYNQLRGFDISEPALRLAALALYITAIELNASPHPPRALKFPRNLRGSVLYRFHDDRVANGSLTSFSLGSLGPNVPNNFDGNFDIIIGNPPWTRLRDRTRKRTPKSNSAAINDEFTEIGRRVLRSRGFNTLANAYENPDKNPDLPFLWRAIEWSKEGGIIALAMPARLFGRTTGKGLKAWRAVLRSVKVTGLINGSDLRKTAVWNGVDMPFCLFFARNRVPEGDYRFHYATPAYEPDLNNEGRFRIDYERAHPISAALAAREPSLLKTLSLGTWIDVEIMKNLLRGTRSLKEHWSEWDPKGHKTGQGYILAPDSPQKYVDFLAELPVFEKSDGHFMVKFDELLNYGALFGTNDHGISSAHMPRRKELYQAPLVIIPKAPGEDPYSPKAYISDKAISFSQTYYGYSCAGHPEQRTLASLIYLLAHSTLFRYFILMISVSHGADHMIFTKQDLDAFPFPDIHALPKGTRTTICHLARQLQRNARKPWEEMNEFIFDLYGLSAESVQVIRDTLFASASYRKSGRNALDCTTHGSRSDYRKSLHEVLEPYFEVCGEHVAVREAPFQDNALDEPWCFISISREVDDVCVDRSLICEAMASANRSGCSRIIVRTRRKRGLLIGLLNQNRWWTITRARLCAQHIVRELLGECGLPEVP